MDSTHSDKEDEAELSNMTKQLEVLAQKKVRLLRRMERIKESKRIRNGSPRYTSCEKNFEVGAVVTLKRKYTNTNETVMGKIEANTERYVYLNTKICRFWMKKKYCNPFLHKEQGGTVQICTQTKQHNKRSGGKKPNNTKKTLRSGKQY